MTGSETARTDETTRSARAWWLLTLAVALEVTGTLSMKAALTAPWLFAIVAIGYVGAFFLLMLVLRAGLPLGVAYGVWSASGVVLTAVLSAFLFGEPITFVMGLGVVLVVGGVLCIELGSQAAHAPAEGTR